MCSRTESSSSSLFVLRGHEDEEEVVELVAALLVPGGVARVVAAADVEHFEFLISLSLFFIYISLFVNLEVKTEL